MIGIDGYVVGVKLTNEVGSMDSAKAENTHGPTLAKAVAYRAVQMIKPDLATIAILGFYLLTGDLAARSARGGEVKRRLYRSQARTMHKELLTKLQHLTEFEVVDGSAWVLSEKPYDAYGQFTLLENELAKQLQVTLC